MDSRGLFKADAVFEAVLALVLIAGAGAGWLTRTDLPVGRGGVVAAGVALGVFAVVLLYLRRAGRRVLLALGLLNEVAALACLVWLIAATRFSAIGAVIVSSTVVGLFTLSVLQLRAVMVLRQPAATQ
jgi:hypothetical protein